MFITRFGISRPVVVRLVLILTVVLGLYSYRAMPKYLDPDLTIGEALVITTCPGFSPEEVEKLITTKLEEKLKGISEIRRYESTSFEGTSKIHVFFNTRLSEYEIDQAIQEVRNAVDQVQDLPPEADTPRVVEIEIALFPVCLVGLAGNLPMMKLQEIAEDVAETLEEIEGVSIVEIMGERDEEIWVELDPSRLSALGLSIAQVASAISSRVRNLPGGWVEQGSYETSIRMLGEPKSIEQLGSIVVANIGERNILLDEIATIKRVLERPKTLTFIDEAPALILAIKRKRHTNMIRIVDEVKEVVKTLPSQYPGLTTTIYFNQAREIKRRIGELQTNAGLGIVAVFLILWASMGIRNALYASIGIPVAFFIAFIFMNSIGLSIDGVTLFALILVLGIIVDDAIVVLENIFRHMEMGKSVAKASLEGTREVVGPVIASVTTTIAAFFPLLFMVGGVIGRFLAILPKVVIAALLASLLEVFFMLPSHVVELSPTERKRRSFARTIDIFSPVRRIYYPFLRVVLRHRYVSVVVIVFSTVLAILLYFQTDFVLFPKSDAFPRFNIYFDLPVGSSIDRSKQTLMKVSRVVRERLGNDLVAPIAVAGMKEVNYEPVYGPHYGMLNVILKPKGERRTSVKDLMESVRHEVTELLFSLGATSVVLERMLEGPPVGKDVDLKIQASSWESAAEISRLLRAELARHPGIVDITDNYNRAKQFLEITIDEMEAKRLGLSQHDITMAVQAAFHGLTVATYNQGEKSQDIKLIYPQKYRSRLQALMNLKIMLPGVGEVPLNEVAQVRLVPGFHNIYHYNGKQTVRLTANISDQGRERKGIEKFLSHIKGEGLTATKANQIARDHFEKIKADYPGARMIAGGLQDETNKSLEDLKKAAYLALFLIFFILAIEFNSFTQPFIIMLTIPFVTLGVMVGLIVSQNPLTFVTLIGLLTLAGIVVNDSLVLIDFMNRFRDQEGLSHYQAIVRACHIRMRPILLTSITTICGLAPMAFGLGGKSIFWAPLATAIMWGLGFATFLILTMVPAYYAILHDLKQLLRQGRRPSKEVLAEIDVAFTWDELRPHYSLKAPSQHFTQNQSRILG